MRRRIAVLAAEAVPCWGGTGTVALPAHFNGDCDKALPRLPCPLPPAWIPDWCNKTAPPPPPSPPSPPGPLHCGKPSTVFCGPLPNTTCGLGASTSLHKGQEDEDDCAKACLARATCNCFHLAPTGMPFHCHVFAGARSVVSKAGVTAYVRGTDTNLRG